MSDEEINAAIAEACGWTQVEALHRSGRCPGATYVGREFIPDYCNSLDAMYFAEQRLWAEQHYLRYTFVDELGKMLKQNQWFKIDACDMVDLTARQRAEALLKALGKWKEAAK